MTADLGSAFPALTSSWFRLETLQAYDVDEEREELEAFLRTGRLDTPGDEEWQAMIRRHVAAGRSLRRVHIVEEPLSDYMRYEIAGYLRNQEAGEDIRLIPVPAGEWPEDLPPLGTDYWLIDDGQPSGGAWVMEYDHGGRWLASTYVDDPGTIDDYRRWRDTALDRSVPLNEYLARNA